MAFAENKRLAGGVGPPIYAIFLANSCFKWHFCGFLMFQCGVSVMIVRRTLPVSRGLGRTVDFCRTVCGGISNDRAA